MAAKKQAKKARKAAKPKSAAANGHSVTVPAKNVGAACQAAVSFEGAVHIEATELEGSDGQYVVTWS